MFVFLSFYFDIQDAHLGSYFEILLKIINIKVMITACNEVSSHDMPAGHQKFAPGTLIQLSNMRMLNVGLELVPEDKCEVKH